MIPTSSRSSPFTAGPVDKTSLLTAGVALMTEFCSINALPVPDVVRVASRDWPFSECAYYRPASIHICLERCSAIGTAGALWSCPGYTVDRTPYGVVQHELGHHVDVLCSERRGSFFGDFSVGLRARTREERVSSYCPNDAEWFAEIFRVFVTNPDLLCRLRPKTYVELAKLFTPVFNDSWHDRLAGGPARTVAMAGRKIAAVASTSIAREVRSTAPRDNLIENLTLDLRDH